MSSVYTPIFDSVDTPSDNQTWSIPPQVMHNRGAYPQSILAPDWVTLIPEKFASQRDKAGIL
jgi:hypothetical protein